MEIPRKTFFEKEVTFLVSRSYGPGRYDPTYEEAGHDYPIGYVRWTEGRNLAAFIELLANQRLDVKPLITHRFSINQAPEAYQLITGKQVEPFLGVLLTYPDPTPVEKTVQRASIHMLEVSTERQAGEERIRLGALGAGNFARAVLFPVLRKIPLVDLVGVASASGSSAQSAMKRFGFYYATSDEERIISDPQVNTIAILTRHQYHARQLLASLAAGKHVFCEKPLALNAQELTEITNALEETRGWPLLMVGFNRRFAPLAQRLAEFLHARQEPLVAFYRVNAGSLPADHWLSDPHQGGGRIIGEGCHFIDFLTFLVGDIPCEVSAQGLPDGTAQEENAVITLKFPDGSLGVVSYLANGDKAFSKERLEVFVGGRVAVLDDFRSLELVSNGRRRIIRSRLRQDKGHQKAWETFVSAISLGGLPPIPYQQLVGVTQATFAAVKALRSGQPEPI
jgi:predicted dehydrogenase